MSLRNEEKDNRNGGLARFPAGLPAFGGKGLPGRKGDAAPKPAEELRDFVPFRTFPDIHSRAILPVDMIGCD
jgi:hypothetical protein